MPHRRTHIVLLAGVLVLANAAAPTQAKESKSARISSLKEGIKFYRQATWRWQDTAFVRRTPTAYHERWTKGSGYLQWLAKLWKQRSAKVKRLAQDPPHKREWLCIHRYEGAWNDPNSPYFGGLQMDLEFQQTYGPKLLKKKGTADHWTPLEQMWVAEKAHRSGRGIYPWPNTAPYSPLI